MRDNLIDDNDNLRKSASADDLNQVFFKLPCAVCSLVYLNGEFKVDMANKRFYEIFGYNANEIYEENLLSFCHKDDYEMLCQKLEKAFQSDDDSVTDFECRGVKKNGEIIWVSVSVTHNILKKNGALCALTDITYAKKAEDQLKMTRAEIMVALGLTNSKMGVYYFDEKKFVEYTIQNVDQETSMVDTTDKIIFSEGWVAEESIEDLKNFSTRLKGGYPDGEVILNFVVDKETKWIKVKYFMIYDSEKKPNRAVLSYSEITEQKICEEQEKKLKFYFNNRNDATEKYYEYNLTKNMIETLNGKLDPRIPPEYKSNGVKLMNFVAENLVYYKDKETFAKTMDRTNLMLEYYNNNFNFNMEMRQIDVDGSVYWSNSQICLVCEEESGDIKACVFMQNIDKHKREIESLAELSMYDELTGLLNRRTGKHYISAFIEDSERNSEHAFIILDLDGFKSVNDTYGHIFGDKVIQRFAKVINSHVRSGDICARLGGDEFIMFLKNIKKEALINRMRSLNEAVANSDQSYLPGTCSIGVAMFPQDGKTFDELYAKADIALYRAKETGKNKFIIYTDEINTKKL